MSIGGNNLSLNTTLNTFQSSKFEQGNKVQLDNKTTNFVLFCNPNACFYEYLAYQTEWLQYYTQELGMNMIIFNYRGYGRSDMKSSINFMQRKFGVMNPIDVMKDAEIVLEYAKEKFI